MKSESFIIYFILSLYFFFFLSIFGAKNADYRRVTREPYLLLLQKGREDFKNISRSVLKR